MLMDWDTNDDPEGFAENNYIPIHLYEVFLDSIFCKLVNNFLKYSKD